MKPFQYNDNEIGEMDVTFGIGNMVIGFGVLTLPRTLASATQSSDGWISIVIGGMFALGVSVLLAFLTARFPKQGYREIASSITNVGIANVATLMLAAYALLFVSYETRGLANISKLYLFDKTPDEAICLIFLLVLAYGVSGPSVSLLRLNFLFLPAVLLIIFVVMMMNVKFFNIHTLKPVFVTDWKGLLVGAKGTALSFLGFEIILFYNVLIQKPKRTVKAVASGMMIPFVLYLVVFLFIISVFGTEVTKNTLYPTAELAKQVEIPGGFFERFESIFFTVWVITLFNTAAMAFDVTILALRSVFPKVSRMGGVICLCPVIYLFSMQPRNVYEIEAFGEWISYAGIVAGWFVPLLLLLLAKIRGIKGE